MLGALAPAERADYERHLAGCAACRESVAELAVLPGLLGRLDPAGLEQFLRSARQPPGCPRCSTPPGSGGAGNDPDPAGGMR